MNDLVPTHQFPDLNLEDPEMIQGFMQILGNALLRGSQLAQTVRNLERDMEEMKLRVRDAVHQKELADNAYQQVNGQRIAAENECVSLRTERNNLEKEHAQMQLDLGDVKATVVTLQAEIVQIRAEYDTQVRNLTVERDKALASARDHEDLYRLAEEDKKQQELTIKGLKAELEGERSAANALREANAKLQEIISDVSQAMKRANEAGAAVEEARKANSHWESQPRHPAGTPEGGQFTNTNHH